MPTESLAGAPIHVLLVEDDAKLARLTQRYLESQALIATVVGNGLEAIAEARRTRFDAILLDLMLPGCDGIKVCQTLRQTSDVPIIMVTARGEEADRVLGLEVGADDYVTKPFSSRELLARLRAAVRRARGRLTAEHAPVTAGRVHVDARCRVASLDGETLALTTYEFELLLVFAERPGRVLSREQLLDLARGSSEEVFGRSIDVHICRLRQKLGDDPRKPALLKTIRGVGYVLAVGDEP